MSLTTGSELWNRSLNVPKALKGGLNNLFLVLGITV